MTANQKKNIARFGIATKGVVYCMAGVLTTLAAFSRGGEKSNSKSVFKFLEDQPFGQILLAVVGTGILAYSIWRFYQAFSSQPHDGNKNEDKMKRIGVGISGVIYLSLAALAFKMLLNISGSSGGSGKEKIVGQLLQMEFGQILVGIVAAVILGKGVWQIYKAIKKKFTKKINTSKIPGKAKKVVTNMGVLGYLSRGIVMVIIAYIFFRAAVEVNPSKAGGTKEAFDFIENTFGQVLLVAIAVGFVCYGLFLMVEARYRNLNFIS